MDEVIILRPTGEDDGRWRSRAHPERSPCYCFHRGQFTHLRLGQPVRRYLLSRHGTTDEPVWQLFDRVAEERIGGLWYCSAEEAMSLADAVIELQGAA